MDLLDVKKVSADGIRDRILAKSLRVISGHREHFLGLDFDWVETQLLLSDCLETMGSMGQEGVSLDPVEAIHVHEGQLAGVSSTLLLFNAELNVHIDIVNLGPSLNERKVEKVPVESHNDNRLGLFQVVEESHQSVQLVGLVENGHWKLEIFSWTESELLNVPGDNLSVNDQKCLLVDHVGNHHDLIDVCVGELHGSLGGLDIIGTDDELRFLQ